MLVTPVPNEDVFGPVRVNDVPPFVDVTSGAAFICIPNVYLPPKEIPGAKYQSNPKFAPNPIELPDVLF